MASYAINYKLKLYDDLRFTREDAQRISKMLNLMVKETYRFKGLIRVTKKRIKGDCIIIRVIENDAKWHSHFTKTLKNDAKLEHLVVIDNGHNRLFKGGWIPLTDEEFEEEMTPKIKRNPDLEGILF